MSKFTNIINESWTKSIYQESSNSTMTFYHGGKLDDSYDLSKRHKKGRWEYGPGLYLTTHVDTARKYAKGGRRLYKIQVEKGTDISNAKIPADKVQAFIKSYIKAKARRSLIDDLERWTENDMTAAMPFLNLIINDDLIAPRYTNELRSFLVENGIDYHLVSNAFGWGEMMMVLFNPDKIIQTTIVKPDDKVDDLPTEFN